MDLPTKARLRLWSRAAGSATGAAELHHMAAGLSMAASLDPRHVAPWDHVTSTVAVVTLDDLLAELEVDGVGLIKIDAEATEAEVLGGARGILDRNRPHIICEVLGDEAGRRLTEILEPLAYHFCELCLDGPRERPDLSPREAQNYLCTTAPLAALRLG